MSDDGVGGSPYDSITDPERYRTLHPAAREVIGHLQAKYDVQAEEHQDGDGDAVVTLTPTGTGASITVEFTSFPGIRIRCGRWYSEAFPRCGCDACEEDPAELVTELIECVDAVTDGRFFESLHGNVVSARLTLASGSTGGSHVVDGQDWKPEGEPLNIDWPAWPQREIPRFSR